MGQRRKQARVYGPYTHRAGFRVVVVAENGGRTDRVCATEEEAGDLIRDVQSQLALEERLTVNEAIDRYESHKRLQGGRPTSIATTCFRLRSLFKPVLKTQLTSLASERCARLYLELAARQAADTHRNALAEAKTWADWLVEERLLRRSPLAQIRGVGARRRGKAQLRVDEARRWLAAALEHADDHPGAVAAACALLMGLRASEIVLRVGRDLDDDGRLLWIDAAKTDAGRRVVAVPEELRPHLKRLAASAGPLGLLWKHRPAWVRSQVKRLCRIANVPEVTAHGLRGGHSSIGIEAGLSPMVVAATLGHASPSMTLSAYARPEAVVAAAQGRTLAMIRGVR